MLNNSMVTSLVDLSVQIVENNMLKSKENDWLFNVLANPQMDTNAFEEVGLNATNTSLEDEEVYLNLDKITNDSRFQTNGVFDEAKFHELYQQAEQQYNILARDTHYKELSTFVDYYKTDIFTPHLKPEQEAKRQQPTTQLMPMPNPNRLNLSTRYLGYEGASKLSQAEIGQTNRILENAKDVDFNNADFSKAKWGPSVNDIALFTDPIAYFKNLGRTIVLSTWEEDGQHVDPMSGQIVEHKKGDPRHNDQGEVFYEYLDGREVYGKQVLSKFDYLTVDGTKINSYDFFDSDDKHKTTEGTLMREAVCLLPIFIPGVSSVYLGMRVFLQAAQLFTTLDKMVVDWGYEDTPLLNETLGFFDSLHMSTSEHSQQHTMTWENVITMASDVAMQLAEQRWLFKNVARLKAAGNDITKQEVRDQIVQERVSQYMINGLQEGKTLEEARLIAQRNAMEELKDIERAAQHFGEELSRLYMTGITIMDAYGEAKDAGASDLGAAALTLGYAAGEYGILRTDLGKWILPELKAERFHLREMLTTLMKGKLPMPEDAVDKNVKGSIIKKLMGYARAAVKADYAGIKGNTLKETLGAGLSNSLGEAIEETSEELLYDAVKSIGNLVSWATDSDADFKPFDNWLPRYGMSFFGGALGGAIAQFDPSYISARFQRGNMTYDQAMQELIWIIGEGKEEDLIKALDKIPVNNKYLSSLSQEERANALQVPQGTERDNMDVASKNMVKQSIKFFKDILSAHGADLSAKSILRLNTELYKDLKVQLLSTSAAAASFLQDFNTARAKLIKAEAHLAALTNPGKNTYSDSNKAEYFEQYKSDIESARKDVKEADEVIQSYLNGERAPKLIRKIIKEMHPEFMNAFMKVNEASYAYTIYGESYKSLDATKKAEIHQRWEDHKEKNFKDDLEYYDEFSHESAMMIAPVLMDTENKYFKEVPETKDMDDFLNLVNKTWEMLLDPSALKRDLEAQIGAPLTDYDYAQEFKNLVEQVLGTEGATGVSGRPEITFLQTVLKDEYADFKASNPNPTVGDVMDFFNEQIGKHISTKIIDPLLKQGYVHPEVRSRILEFVDTAENQWGIIFDADTKNNFINPLKSLPSVPILQILENVSVALGNTPIISIKDLMDQVEKTLRNPVLDQIVVSKELQQAIENAYQVINIVEMNLTGASTDNADIDNILGINATVNELEKLYNVPMNERSNLAEIRSDVAERIKSDLRPIVTKLRFLQRIQELNVQAKADTQPKIAARSYKIFYNKVTTKLLGHLRDKLIPKDTEKYNKNGAFDKLDAVLNGLVLLKDPLNVYYNKQQQKELEKERIKFEDALYEYFNTILPTDTSTFDEYTEIFQELEFFDMEEQKLDLGTTDLSDAQFLHWLFSITAVRTSSFLKEYNNAINAETAPIPVQEIPIREAYALLMNGPYVEKWLKGIKHYVANQVRSRPSGTADPRIHYSAELPYEPCIVPRYMHTLLIEGVAGSGKTQAILRMLFKMVGNNTEAKSKLLSHAFVASVGESEAEQLSNNLKLNNSKVHSRHSLLSFITGGLYDTDKLKVDKQIVDYEKLSLVDDVCSLSVGFKDLDPAAIPSIIIIDEIGRFTAIELDLIDRFAQKYGIPVITTGDLDQSRTEAKGVYNNGSRDININTTLFRGNFYHSPKVGFSFRADNNLKSYNQKLIEDKLKDLYKIPYGTDANDAQTYIETFTPEDYIHFKYCNNENGFYGDLISAQEEEGVLPEELVKSIQKMFETFDMGPEAKPNKIGFIQNHVYEDGDSSLLEDYLNTATFTRTINGVQVTFNCKDYISKFDGLSAQGKEAQYYIVDLDAAGDLSSASSIFWRSFYTGMTRASQGTITYLSSVDAGALYSPQLGSESTPEDWIPFINSVKVQYVVKDPLNPQIVATIANNRKTELDDVLEDSIESPTFTEFEHTTPTVTTTVMADSFGDYQVPGNPMADNTTTTIPVESKVPEEPKEQNGSTSTATPAQSGHGYDFDMIAYTHLTHSTGLVRINNNWELPSNFNSGSGRIDNINGLARIFNWTPAADARRDATIKSYMEIIDQLRDIALYQKDPVILQNEMQKLLDNDAFGRTGKTITDIKLGYSKLGIYGSARRDAEEELTNIHGDTSRSGSTETNKHTHATISLFFYFDSNQPELEIPLYALPNYQTMLKSSVTRNLTAVQQIWQSILRQRYNNDNDRAIAFLNALVTYQNNNSSTYTPGIKQIIDILTLYTSQNGTYLPGYSILSPGEPPANYLTASGPFISPYVKGDDYTENHELNNAVNSGRGNNTNPNTVKHPITDFKADNGVIITNPLISISGTVVSPLSRVYRFAEEGKPFILVTDDPTLKTENEIIQAFYEQVQQIAKNIDNLSTADLAQYLKDNVVEVKKGSQYEETFLIGRRIKVVYVVPPAYNIRDYLKQAVDIFTQRNPGRDEFIGNDFTLLEVVNFFLNSKDAKINKGFKSGLKIYPGIDTKIKQAINLVEELEKKKKAGDKASVASIREKLKDLIHSENHQLIHQARALLLRTFTRRTTSDAPLEIIDDILNDLVNEWETVRKANNQDVMIYINPLKELITDANSDSFLFKVPMNPTHPYTVNGDIQSATVWGDLDHAMDKILQTNNTRRIAASNPVTPTATTTTETIVPLRPPVIELPKVEVKDIACLTDLVDGVKDTIVQDLTDSDIPIDTLQSASLQDIQKLYLNGITKNGTTIQRILLLDSTGGVEFLSEILKPDYQKCMKLIDHVEYKKATVSRIILQDATGRNLFVGTYEKNSGKVILNTVQEVPVTVKSEVTITPIEIEQGSFVDNLIQGFPTAQRLFSTDRERKIVLAKAKLMLEKDDFLNILKTYLNEGKIGEPYKTYFTDIINQVETTVESNPNNIPDCKQIEIEIK